MGEICYTEGKESPGVKPGMEKRIWEALRMMKLGAQLYTLRNYLQNEKDFAFCMKEVAAMGYKTVQISGAGPLSAKFMREVCDENGLSIVLTHIDGEKLLRHTDDVIRDHEILGCDYIGIGSMPERYRTPEWVHHFADDYLPVAREIRAAGKYFMYHHHNFEFEKFPGGRFIEILLDSFAPRRNGHHPGYLLVGGCRREPGRMGRKNERPHSLCPFKGSGCTRLADNLCACGRRQSELPGHPEKNGRSRHGQIHAGGTGYL